MDPQGSEQLGAVLAPPRPVPPRRPRATARPVPQRSPQHAHLTLEALRGYRTALQAEEAKVSYWRRILQARLDLLLAGSAAGHLDATQLRPVLSEQRSGRGRSALVELVPVDDIPPLPDLAELWERRVGLADEAGLAALVADLSAAEAELSAYRTALHVRLGDATGELIARYRDQPTLCLSALPVDPLQRTARL